MAKPSGKAVTSLKPQSPPSTEIEALDAYGLNPRQRAFADGYLADGNATRSYMAAGYECKDGDVASAAAARLLATVKVAEYVSHRQRAIYERHKITSERILVETARIAFLDQGQALDDDGKFLRLDKMPEDVRRAIESVEMDEKGNVLKVRFIGKKGALDLLGRHHRLWTDRDVAPVVPAGQVTNIQNNTLVVVSPLDAYKQMLSAPREP
jgi:phage terminase small subunit